MKILIPTKSLLQAWLFILSASACSSGPPSEPASRTLSSQIQLDSPADSRASNTPRKFTKGEILYLRDCADCHGFDGEGDGPAAAFLGVSPPSVTSEKLFLRHSQDELVASVLFGKVLAGPLNNAESPNTAADISALSTYMRRLPTIDWRQVNAGQDVYDEYCVGCHGIYGRGDGDWSSRIPVPLPDLTAPLYQNQLSDEQLVKIISEGKGTMPGTADVLASGDLRDVIAFVRILSPGFVTYDRYCVLCHGPEGVPMELAFIDESGIEFGHSAIPIFDAFYFQNRTDEQLRSLIKHMLAVNRATMPHFAGQLFKDEVAQILTYLRSLAKGKKGLSR